MLGPLSHLEREAGSLKKREPREFRAVERFAVRLPVFLNWRGAEEQECRAEGFTRDISTRGMFVVTNNVPPEGRVLQFEIDLAFDEGAPLTQVEGQGRVVRVERASSNSVAIGLAVSNIWFKLRAPQDGQALIPPKKPKKKRLSVAWSKVKPFPKPEGESE
jgi:hypothetical protein